MKSIEFQTEQEQYQYFQQLFITSLGLEHANTEVGRLMYLYSLLHELSLPIVLYQEIEGKRTPRNIHQDKKIIMELLTHGYPYPFPLSLEESGIPTKVIQLFELTKAPLSSHISKLLNNQQQH